MSSDSQNEYSLFGHYINGTNKNKSKEKVPSTFGQKAAEKVASFVGSWKFIVIQSILLFIWMSINVLAVAYAWDPYPFILMNLFLSMQAAYTAPLILMAENRQSAQDRSVIYDGWNIDRKINNTINDMELYMENKLQQNNEKLDKIIAALDKRKEE